MKTVLISALLLFSAQSFAEKFCGSLNSFTVDNDIYSVERMSLYNKKSNPKVVVVKHADTLVLMAGLLTNNPNFDRYADGVDWYWKDSADRYFVCVEGSELREYRNDFFMDEVYDLRVWKNGSEI